jgi:hypothetical protein
MIIAFLVKGRKSLSLIWRCDANLEVFKGILESVLLLVLRIKLYFNISGFDNF